MKYDPSGNQLWNETWGGADADSGRGVAVDGSGNAYIAGRTGSFGAGFGDAFLVKYDPSGNLLWNETWGGAAYDYGNGVAVDGSGNAYVAGFTDSFGAGGYDAFLVKYDPSGNLLWNETWGGAAYDYGNGVAVDGSGNAYVAGYTDSFGASFDDAFLVKYDPSGNLLWNETWGGAAYDYGNGVAVDGSGNAYVAGYTDSFGASFDDAFLVKYDMPIIIINSPIDNQLFGTNAPTFDLTISGASVSATWYTIDGGLTNYTFIGTSGTIDQTAWDARPNGTVTIRFYVNDTLEYLNYNEVTVRKDILAPSITINSPIDNQLFGSSAPTFDLTIAENNLDTTWYTIDGGLTNYTFVGTSDTINQGAWNAKSNGTVTIRFYANDTLGNLYFNEVTVRKDISAPIITINSPIDNQLFGTNAPTFDLTISGASVDATWYTIDGGLTNYTFVGTSGTIDQTAWNAKSNGAVTIRFYANNTLGNLNYNEVTVRKDISAPIITINSPTPNQLFGNSAPTFDLTIAENNLDTTWYTIDGGLTNYTFVGTSGTIDQTAWDNLNDGQVTIRFYANDTFGRIGFQEVTIRKDVNAPIITINNPQDSDVIGETAPNFDISIVESNLDKTWYSLNGGANITFTGLTGTINQALWDALPEGNVIIRFYANDTLGRIRFQEVTVVKTISQPSPPGIPGYNILLLLGIVSTIAVIIVKKRLNRLN